MYFDSNSSIASTSRPTACISSFVLGSLRCLVRTCVRRFQLKRHFFRQAGQRQANMKAPPAPFAPRPSFGVLSTIRVASSWEMGGGKWRQAASNSAWLRRRRGRLQEAVHVGHHLGVGLRGGGDRPGRQPLRLHLRQLGGVQPAVAVVDARDVRLRLAAEAKQLLVVGPVAGEDAHLHRQSPDHRLWIDLPADEAVGAGAQQPLRGHQQCAAYDQCGPLEERVVLQFNQLFGHFLSEASFGSGGEFTIIIIIIIIIIVGIFIKVKKVVFRSGSGSGSGSGFDSGSGFGSGSGSDSEGCSVNGHVSPVKAEVEGKLEPVSGGLLAPGAGPLQWPRRNCRYIPHR
ncbi:hypothetical protein TYRP_003859 [Tyrophagus putrescentiae]|nr:hypothetical protein TYRP_003859 [Tyrophagus putrescentiae]